MKKRKCIQLHIGLGKERIFEAAVAAVENALIETISSSGWDLPKSAYYTTRDYPARTQNISIQEKNPAIKEISLSESAYVRVHTLRYGKRNIRLYWVTKKRNRCRIHLRTRTMSKYYII